MDARTPNTVDDAEFVAALKAGDARAFERLVREQGPRLLAVARRMMREDAAAQDCLQDAFLSAHRAIAKFEPHGTLGAWMHRITVNACLMRLRSQKRLAETPIDDLLPNFSDEGVRLDEPRTEIRDPETALEVSRTRAMVREKMAELPDAYRIVLQLRDIDGFSTREAADMMGIAEGALKVRLHRARAALKRLMEPLWEEFRPR